jgi:succinate dehydrogenase / fumarate reductase, membrane anchor subunit
MACGVAEVNQVNYRTPLARVRGLGSAHEGARTWWTERLTSIAAVPLTLFLLGYLLSYAGAPRADIVASFRNPFVAAGFLLAWLALLWHMKLGMQVIIEDYVHSRWKLPLLIANTFLVMIMGALALWAIAVMSLGAPIHG